MDLALKISNLNKTYKTKQGQEKNALKNINLQIPQGSFFGLLGPNGAGKSTLINIIAGITNKTSGQIYINDVDLDTQTKLAKKNIGIVPQEVVIDPFFNVFETLEIYAGYFGIRKKDRQTLQILKNLGLEDKITAKPRTLSGGMKRRLLIAKALVHSPKLLILDEPTAGVDVELRNQLWDYVKKLNKSGTTILLTTHYLEEAEELCDEIAIINNGTIIACDKKDNLIQILDEKQLIISFDEQPKAIKSDKFKVICQNNQLIINYKTSIVNAGTIIEAVQKDSQAKIIDIATSQADLEDVFKYLIK